ncbi:cation:proton antiporter [Dactylosporangium siamense]|uniref:Cation/H+ exchanger transmembrane domain-containing protein n=1 Tax=Dactylosporangium siamense TaxID=685454 RepID=A0A919PYL7_9ACTN|nr:cation:proton antiporter [Dactylosporangium siamense]GIG52484.1 hypothetical protein Dsi01nite_105250 [Dactylosporangium siamense]
MQSPATHADLTIATAVMGVAVIMIGGWLLGRLATRLRQPVVVGEIVCGIVLGPSVLGLLPGDLTGRLFPAEVRPMLSAIAQIGLLLFMFMVGWEFDRGLLRGRGTAAVGVSFSSMAVAFAVGAGLAALLYPRHSTTGGHHVPAAGFVLFLGAAMAITAFPVLARILSDSGLMHTRVGALALASAAISDLLAWCVLALVSALVTASGPAAFWQTMVLSLLYLLAMWYVVRPLLARLFGRLAGGRPANLMVLVAGGVFLSAYASTWVGLHSIFGAFVFGLVTPREPADTLQVHLRRPLSTAGQLLMPVFFIVTGLSVQIGGLTWVNYVELAAILGVACAGKLVGSVLPGRISGLPWREAGLLGLLMNARGLTELVILNAGLSLGVLDTPMYTMMVIMAVVTTGLVGPLLSRFEPASAPDAATRAPADTSPAPIGSPQ